MENIMQAHSTTEAVALQGRKQRATQEESGNGIFAI
jgi:hypothetical protein